jgi:hypothetical protein
VAAERMRRGAIVVALLVGLLIGAVGAGLVRLPSLFSEGPDPETIATASLQSVREQARLTPFVASFVSVVTSRQSRFGLTAEKTMIMPGTVRYELNLAAMRDEDLAWDPAAATLTVTLPPIEIAGPEIDLAGTKEYSGGGVLMAVTSAEDRLDQANRGRAQANLLEQARGAVPMRMARVAAKQAVERSFAMPLRAAGVEARVVAEFADERGSRDPSRLDRSRRMEDVVKDGAK